MVKFLFWNIHQKPLERIIANLALKHEIDVLILAESLIPVEVVLAALNQRHPQYHFPTGLSERLAIYTRFSRDFLQPVFDTATSHTTIRRLRLPAQPEILLVAVHLSSKLYRSGIEQTDECKILADEIRRVEAQAGHSRTMLVGDLNLNPFEEGVIAVTGLNAVMTRSLARRRVRLFAAQQFPLFYNPMWGHFGDRPEGPPGTYYHNWFWHVFDQVLLRPALLDLFRNEQLRILTDDGENSFLSREGLPNARIASDHLPIVFALDLA